MTYDFEKQRPREFAGKQRFESVQDDSVTKEPAFDGLPTVEQDITIGQGAPLRSLVIVDGDSSRGGIEHVSYAGQSTDKEHLSRIGLRWTDNPNAAHAPANMRHSDDHSVLTTTTRQAAMLGQLLLGEDLDTGLNVNNQCAGMPLSGATSYAADRGPIMFWPHTTASQGGAFGLPSISIGEIPAGIARVDFAYLWLRGRTGNGALAGDHQRLNLRLRNDADGLNTSIPYFEPAGETCVWAQDTTGRNTAWDHIALQMVHTSALDAVIQWKPELDSLRSALAHFRMNESVGFYERSGRGTLWNMLSDTDTMVAMWLTHLGYYQRVGKLPDNLNHASAQANEFAGFYNPFVGLRVRNYDNAGGVREWYPDWVARLVDNKNFTYVAETPEYGISLEDMFLGFNALMEAACLEEGLAARATFTPQLEFFDEAASGKMHDYQSEDARTSTTTLRSLAMLGLATQDEYLTPTSVSNMDRRHQYAYFNSFLEAGQINNTAKMDHANNMADLENVRGLMTLLEPFKTGMQQLGVSTTTIYDRTYRDGSLANVKLNLVPTAAMRVQTSPLLAAVGNDNSIHNGMDQDVAYLVNGANGITNSLGIHASQIVDCGVGMLGNQVSNWANVHVVWPSTMAGYNQFDRLYQHARTMTHINTGQSAGQIAYITSNLGNLGYGAVCTPLGHHLSGGNDVGTWHTEIWSLNRNNQLVHLIRAVADTLGYWVTASNALPRKSNLTIVAPTALNLVREMTMMQGEALVQQNLPYIMHMLHCGMHTQRFSLQARHTDRQLSNFDVHARPGRYASSAGADYLTWLLPDTLLADDPASVITLGDMLLYRFGCLRAAHATFTSTEIEFSLQQVSPSDGSYSLFRGLTAAFIGGEVLRLNANRYYGVLRRFRDGSIDDMFVTVPETAGPRQVSRGDTNTPDNLYAVSPTYNYVTSTMVTDHVNSFNSAAFYPGHLEMFSGWDSLNPAAGAAMGNSLCGLGGLRNAPHVDGSNVAGLLGYAGSSAAIEAFLLAVDVPHLALLAADTLIADNAGFDPELWRRVSEARGSIEDWSWTRLNWKLLNIDQDVLDTDTTIFRALCAGNRLLLVGPIHRMTVIDKDCEVVREVEDLFQESSMGGVAVGKGKYTETEGDYDIDLDGDTRTSNRQDG